MPTDAAPPSIVIRDQGKTPVFMEDMYTPPFMNRGGTNTTTTTTKNTPQTGPNTEVTRQRAKSIANAFKKHDRSISTPNAPALPHHQHSH